MEKILKDLAERLHDLRLRSNRVTLRHVLDMAKILVEARDVAKRDFGRWVRETAHMQYDTARRYLRVSSFVDANHDLNREIASLSISKVYALSSLDLDTARRLVIHQEAFSKPLERMSDVEFLREFRLKYPKPSRRRTRVHVYQELSAALTRLKKSIGKGERYAGQMSELQRERIGRELAYLGTQSKFWMSKRGTA